MKRILLVVMLVLLAAGLGLVRHGVAFGRDQEVRNEIKQNYVLAPGARVEIAGINGVVRIETSDRASADADILVIGNDPEDVKNAITIEQTAQGLVIRGNRRGFGLFQRLLHGDIHQNVTLSAPTNIQLVVRGVNGKVTSGVVDGTAQISGINGTVDLAQASGYSEINGVNGGVSVGVRKLDEKGLRISGINGGVVLRLGSDLNADLNAHGINGKVRSEALNLTVDEDHPRSRFSGKIGSGGAPINISGVNGGVKLISADSPQLGEKKE